jgi:hypothetical protein
MHDQQRSQVSQPATPQQQPVGYVPDHAIASSEENVMADKQANGGGFTTDRDEQGEPKAPEVVGVPRLAKKKKKEAEEPTPAAPVDPVGAPPTDQVPDAAPVAPVTPPPAPAPAGNGKVNPIEYIPTETLIKVIGDLPKEDDFAQNKNKQDALVSLTEILKARPVLPPEQPEGQAAAAPAPAPAMPMAASKKKADLGDHAMDSRGTINEPSAAPAVSVGAGNNISTDGANPAPQKAKTDIDLGGLSIAGALEDEKTADDYRLVDYKLQDEGVVPSGRLPNMDDQESQMHPEEEFEMESSAPPHSENVVHALKDESGVDNPFAVAWSMHNKGDKMSAVKSAIAAVHSILASGSAGSWFVGSGEPADMTEDGGRLPELAEAHRGLDYSPMRVERPATTAPIQLNKQAAEMTTSKAVKQAEQLGNDLKKMYLEAKSLTQVNDTRVVREAVESIFRAGDMMDNALKALGKQHEQEENEAAAQEIKAKNKKSNVGGLALAAAE